MTQRRESICLFVHDFAAVDAQQARREEIETCAARTVRPTDRLGRPGAEDSCAGLQRYIQVQVHLPVHMYV